ncbi:MAG TPA: Hsp20/alpha crystallin family protein [Chthoniobacterales bacterium]|jgi:HSP20 family protein
MDPIRTLRLRWVYTTLTNVRQPLGGPSFSPSAPPRWEPAINAYRCDESIQICVDLAGVKQSEIDLQIESQRLILRGTREVPEPDDCALQTIAMEIDYGPFMRVLKLPEDTEVNEARAEQRNGFLWIHLPLRKS